MAEGFMESLVQGSELGEIEPVFQSFISQPGVPLVSVALSCLNGKNPNLAVRQSRYAPLGSTIDPDASLWQIPICISAARGGVVTSKCTLLVEKEMLIDLGDDKCPDYVHPNADGAGYYRFALDDSGWRSLIENAGNLTAAEALSLADSLDAAFSSGTVSAESYLYGLAALVNHKTWDVADAATSYFEGVTNIIERDRLGVLEAAFRGIVGPRFRALDPGQDNQSRLLYRRLLRFMIVMAKDPSLREPLARQAAESIGLDGDPDPSQHRLSSWKRF
jgi:alanyl aminopeptidase